MLTASDYDWERFYAQDKFATNIAYLVLAPKNGVRLNQFTAEEMEGYMSMQCNTEDQACVGDDDCVGDPNFFNPRFYPIAPVQFALKWSPLPYLSSLLGSPSHHNVYNEYRDCVFTVWPKRSLGSPARAHIFSSRVSKFERRSFDIMKEVFKKSNEVGVVVTAGWSYSSRKLSSVARSALKIHGFHFDTRAP